MAVTETTAAQYQKDVTALGCLEPNVVVVKRAVAVLLLALAVRQPANGEQIRTIEQSNPVGEIQPTAGVEFCGDVFQAGGAQTRLNQ